MGVNDLNAAIALFRKAYGWAEPLTENQKDFGKLAYFPGEPVILRSAVRVEDGRRIDWRRFGESPVAYFAGDARLRCRFQEVQAQQHQNLVRAEGRLVRTCPSEGGAGRVIGQPSVWGGHSCPPPLGLTVAFDFAGQRIISVKSSQMQHQDQHQRQLQRTVMPVLHYSVLPSASVALTQETIPT